MFSSSYVLSQPAFIGANPKSILSIPLSSGAAFHLKSLNLKDAVGLWYSGMLSLAQGLGGVNQKRYAWATVKLYYSSFYFLKAALLLAGWTQLYVQGKPRAIESVPGALAKKLEGTSHESCFKLFADVFPSSPLITQLVGVDTAYAWLKSRREEINYNVARFPDPEHPVWFETHVVKGIRQSLATYVGDPLVYAFVPEHAMVAYPVAAGLDVVTRFRPLGVAMGSSDQDGIKAFWKDQNGQLPGMSSFMFS